MRAVVTFKIAFRSLMRRRSRVLLIGLLVVFGTFLLVFGETFTRSARSPPQASIIDNFTGDFIVYSARSNEKPSPFAFQTPLPNIQEVESITAYLASLGEVETVVPFAQNYSLISVDGPKGKIEMPFIFYAVPPASYAKAFANARMLQGDWFATGNGILISQYQNEQYKMRYNVTLAAGDTVTVLGLSSGGGVNAVADEGAGDIRAHLLQERLQLHQLHRYRNLLTAVQFHRGGQRLPTGGLEKGLAAAAGRTTSSPWPVIRRRRRSTRRSSRRRASPATR